MLKLPDIAKRYLAQGFNVIPILPEQKKPALKWMEFNDRKPNNLELQTWFAGKNSNIGIVTGPISKLVVVDIDKPELYNEFIQEYPTNRVQRTASGGYHLLYRYGGSDIGNSVSRLSNGIDVRGNHGYIVTYPSTIRLVNGTLGEYHWKDQGEIKELPTRLHDIIINELSKQHVTTDTDKQDDAKNLFNRVLLNGFTEGRHNEETKDVARYLYRTGMQVDDIINLLSALNTKDSTPLPTSELLATVNSGISYEKKRLDGKEKSVPNQAIILDHRAMMAKVDGEQNEWLIEDWLRRGSLTMIVAPPENYKTWVALEMAVQVALGDTSNGFLGGSWKGPKKPENVLIVQQEDQKSLLIERVNMILESKSHGKDYMFVQNNPHSIYYYTPYDAPIFYHTEAVLSFDDEQSLKNLETKIIQHNIKLVVIDPLYSLGSSEDYFASMARQLQPFKQLGEKYGVTFVIVHHNKKGTKKAKSIDDIDREGAFGSQLLNGAFEGIIMLNTLSNGQRGIIRQGKAFGSAKEKFIVDFDIAEGRIGRSDEIPYIVRLSAPPDTNLDDDAEKMRDALAEMIEGTASGIAKEAGLKGNNDKFNKIMSKLVDIGIATVKEEKKWGKNKVIVYEFVAAY